ncbi:MAG: hypothetical protein AAF533_14295 [Acidobacteriota bacterium]
MLLRVFSRCAAAALAILTLAVLVLMVQGLLSGEPLLRTVARLLFALALAHGAWASWRSPVRRGPRQRRRLLEMLQVLSDPELQRDFAETSPALPAPMALIEDWRTVAASLDDEDVAASFDEVELRELLALRGELEQLTRFLPDLDRFENDPQGEVEFLREDPDWQRLTERAGRTFARFASRDAA